MVFPVPGVYHEHFATLLIMGLKSAERLNSSVGDMEICTLQNRAKLTCHVLRIIRFGTSKLKNNKKGNAEWITAERCEWDLPDFEEEEFTIIDELLIQAPDEFGMDDAVTEKYLEEHPELKAWMEEGNV